MRFFLIDRIEELIPRQRIRAIKNLTLAEEYLREHFPLTPVMPGVFMIEAMTQAAAWLIRVSEDFRHSLISLKEASNVKYGKFVEPGQTLRVEAAILAWEDSVVTVRASGSIEDRVAVQARLVLQCANLGQVFPGGEEWDGRIVARQRELLALLWSGATPSQRDKLASTNRP